MKTKTGITIFLQWITFILTISKKYSTSHSDLIESQIHLSAQLLFCYHYLCMFSGFIHSSPLPLIDNFQIHFSTILGKDNS